MYLPTRLCTTAIVLVSVVTALPAPINGAPSRSSLESRQNVAAVQVRISFLRCVVKTLDFIHAELTCLHVTYLPTNH